MFHPHPCQIYSQPIIQKNLDRKKHLDPTTLNPQFLSMLFFTQLFTHFTFSFSRGFCDLPLNQRNKYKRLWLSISIGIQKLCNITIVITDDIFFIFLTNVTTFYKEMKFLLQLMLWANNFNHNYNINVYTFNSCSNYLLTFIIICPKFSVHITSYFVDGTKLWSILPYKHIWYLCFFSVWVV